MAAVKTSTRPASAQPKTSARDRLLAAADELFYAEGVHVVGVDRIVERAGVTKASLYNTFGSKDELVRAYLERHLVGRRNRIGKIVGGHSTPRAQILGVFAEVEDLLEGSAFRGCRFISAAAESRPGEAGEVVGEQYRAFLWSLFTDLAEAAGAPNPKQLGRQLFLLYDGAAVAARMDKDRGAAADAVRSAVEALLDSEVATRRSNRRSPKR